MNAQKNKADLIMRWAVFIALALTQAVLIYKLIISPGSEIAILFAMVVIAGLLLISPRIFDLLSLQISKSELRAELNPINERIKETESKIETLFLITMSQAMFSNLKKLDEAGGFGPFDKSTGLERELYHLRDIGYIEVDSVRALPYRGENLSNFVHVTPAGRQFIKFRDSLYHEEKKD